MLSFHNSSQWCSGRVTHGSAVPELTFSVNVLSRTNYNASRCKYVGLIMFAFLHFKYYHYSTDISADNLRSL